MSHVEDRWFNRVGGRLVPTPRNGNGRRWRARWIDPDGRERSASFDKKGQADNHLTEVDANMLHGAYLDPDAGKITLKAYEAQWRASRSWDASTRQTMEHRLDKHVLPGLGSKRLDQLARSPTIISGWLAGLPVGAAYKGQLLTALSSVLAAAVDDGKIGSNPCAKKSVKAPPATRRKIVPWTADEVTAVRAAMPPRYQAMVDCGGGLGLRQGEIFGLPVPAVNFLRRSVRVRVQVRLVGGKPVFAPPKRGKERDVPLPESVSLALAASLEQFPARKVTLPWLEPGGKPHTETLFFPSVRGLGLHRGTFNSDVWRPAREAAGLANSRDNGMHALRHYYASVLLAGGVDIRALSEYLGHHDPGFTLRIYAHLMPGADDRARKAVEAALAAGQNPLAANATGE